MEKGNFHNYSPIIDCHQRELDYNPIIEIIDQGGSCRNGWTDCFKVIEKKKKLFWSNHKSKPYWFLVVIDFRQPIEFIREENIIFETRATDTELIRCN